jgi:hypothetical protein
MRKKLTVALALLAVALVVGGTTLATRSGGTGDTGGPQKIATSRIAKVTAYPDSALVTREVDVPDGQGVCELVVSPLPIRAVNSSLYSEGTDGIRVLSTRFRTRQVYEDTREDVRKAEDELKKLQMAADKFQAEIKIIDANMQMLTKLENFTTVTTVSSTEKGGLNGDNVITLTKYVMEQRAEKAREKVVIQHQLDTNKEQMDYIKRKLKELSAGSSKTERDAVIVVDREAGKGGKVRLNYLVDSVTWRPHYKLRASKASEPVQIDYMAALVQQTGEDWNGVQLTLSTAQPLLNAVPPDLQRLELTVVARASVPAQPGPGGGGGFGAYAQSGAGRAKELEGQIHMLRRQATEFEQKKDVGNSFKALNEAGALTQNWELMKTRDEVLAEAKLAGGRRAPTIDGPSVTYQLGSRLSIPSRNDEQVVEVTKLSMDPKYYYKTVPVLNPQVYRLADLTNKSEHVLLPGEATMYRGADFVGRMTMPLVAVGEEFTVGFGVDTQVQVQRRLIDHTRTMQGGNQVLKYEYQILVSSYKNETVKVQVWDRLPFAETETAGIHVLKTTPALSKDAIYERESRPNNLLRWDLDVEPGRNGEKAMPISYEFRLDLDRQMIISSFIAR